jgi:hypothetical protein
MDWLSRLMVAIRPGFFGPSRGTRKKPDMKPGPARTVSGRPGTRPVTGWAFFRNLTHGLAQARPDKFWAKPSTGPARHDTEKPKKTVERELKIWNFEWGEGACVAAYWFIYVFLNFL